MPPKKKGKKGKGPALIDGVDTASMSREQLEQFALRLKNEMEREREERNFFQLERDKLRTFWEITREQLEEARTTIRGKDRDVEITQELAEVDIKHVVQQMKHLQYEKQTKIGELRAETMTQLKLSQEQNQLQEQELLNDKRELRRLLREHEEVNEQQIQQLKMEHNEKLRQEHENFETEAADMIRLHEQKLQKLGDEKDLLGRMEMFEVEERKNVQIHKLIEAHDNAFNEMKNYYNDITLNNLALISSLKEQMEELRKQSERYERIASETNAENKRLTEPLAAAQFELNDLRMKLKHYDRDRIQLDRLKKKVHQKEKELNSQKWETETLLMRNETLAGERDQLDNKFEEAVMELQQRTGLRNAILDRKVKFLLNEAQIREAMLGEAIVASGLEPSELARRIETIIEEKNTTIDDLHYELARVCKAHDDLLATYEEKLKKFGIPAEELGFEPLKTHTNVNFGAGPAGLVTRNQ